MTIGSAHPALAISLDILNEPTPTPGANDIIVVQGDPVKVSFEVSPEERSSISDLIEDSLSAWTDCVLKSPLTARPHYGLGSALERQGSYNKAIVHYSEALMAIDQ
jgi:hypothetical protein